MLELENFYQKKGKRYLNVLFEKWELEHLKHDEDFDDNLDNDGLKDIVRDKVCII